LRTHVVRHSRMKLERRRVLNGFSFVFFFGNRNDRRMPYRIMRLLQRLPKPNQQTRFFVQHGRHTHAYGRTSSEGFVLAVLARHIPRRVFARQIQATSG
jgi:hypothetical protein